ncbi:MAG: class II fructose-bisphosphate aldolase [Mycobacterium leprae]
MALVSGKEILDLARSGGYGVGAFNVHNIDMIHAVAAVAVAEKAPVILQFTHGSLKFMGWEYASMVARRVAETSPVPMALHLDHGESFEVVMKALRYGFTSVMFDGSEQPYKVNVGVMKQVVEAAHAVGVSVEGEIGHVGGVEDDQGGEHAWLTEPADAERFAFDTGLDYLATAFGTAHGFYKEEPHLDIERLSEIGRRVPKPLVMHGGSGVPDDQVRAAVKAGVAKVNVATELKDAWARGLKAAMAKNPDEIDPRKLLVPALDAVKLIVQEKIRLVGANGRA